MFHLGLALCVTRRLGRRGKRSLEDTVYVELLALHSAFISPMAALLRNKVPRQRLAGLDDCEKACGIEATSCCLVDLRNGPCADLPIR